MHYASAENISKSFGIRILFEDISFHIEEGDKIAFVARNGTGKTTLLNILAGLDTADSGKTWVHKDVKVIYLAQEHIFAEGKTIRENILEGDNEVLKTVNDYTEYVDKGLHDDDVFTDLMSRMDALDAWSLESMVTQILGRLKLQNPEAIVRTLSGGQKKRVALAQALITAQLHEGKCLLILDEPTNHLDVEMIEWLEDFLSSQRSTILLVTHDRRFLDAVCNEIIELENGQIFVYKGDYDYFLEQKSLREDVQASELQKDKNIFRKELEWMRKQPKARTTKSKSRQDAFKVVEERVSQKREENEVSLGMKMTRLGGKVLEMKKVYKAFGEKAILRGFDYTFKRGERIGVVGKNGTGKTTFLRIALREDIPDSGKVNHGETVVFGHFSQTGLVYKEDKRAIDHVKDIAEFFPLADGTKLSASMFMEKFGFNAQQQYTPLSKLSGGEKKRLHLLAVLFRNPNFLVLDEPTNDLDLQTLRTLEEFLADFPGCILIVSHDRYFMDRLTDHIFAFEGDGVVRDYPGNYTQYRVQAAAEAAGTKPERAVMAEREKPKETGAPKKLSFKEKFELEQIDKDLPALQKEKEQLEIKMSSNISFDELQKVSQRVTALVSAIDEKETRWLELQEKL